MRSIKEAFDSSPSIISDEMVEGSSLPEARDVYVDLTELSSVEPLDVFIREGGVRHSPYAKDSYDESRDLFDVSETVGECNIRVQNLSDEGALLTADIMVVDSIIQITDAEGTEMGHRIQLTNLRFVDGCLRGAEPFAGFIEFGHVNFALDCDFTNFAQVYTVNAVEQ